jgi:hypothetical protein
MLDQSLVCLYILISDDNRFKTLVIFYTVLPVKIHVLLLWSLSRFTYLTAPACLNLDLIIKNKYIACKYWPVIQKMELQKDGTHAIYCMYFMYPFHRLHKINTGT